jgi:hypothetical protein
MLWDLDRLASIRCLFFSHCPMLIEAGSSPGRYTAQSSRAVRTRPVNGRPARRRRGSVLPRP